MVRCLLLRLASIACTCSCLHLLLLSSTSRVAAIRAASASRRRAFSTARVVRFMRSGSLFCKQFSRKRSASSTLDSGLLRRLTMWCAYSRRNSTQLRL